jgi:hypothetical protein
MGVLCPPDTRSHRSAFPAANRLWELTGGVLVCGGCGWAMRADRRRNKSGGTYYYYRCGKKKDRGIGACEMSRSRRAEQIERRVWSWVKEQLRDPERLRVGLEHFIEEERSRGDCSDPKRLLAACLRKISEFDAQRARAQDLAIEGLLSAAELCNRLTILEDQRRMIESEAAALRAQQEALADLELEAEVLVERYTAMVPEGLEHFTPEDRHEAYRALRLKVTVGVDGSVEAAGVLSGLLFGKAVCREGSTR